MRDSKHCRAAVAKLSCAAAPSEDGAAAPTSGPVALDMDSMHC